jgi:hypothetical protein
MVLAAALLLRVKQALQAEIRMGAYLIPPSISLRTRIRLSFSSAEVEELALRQTLMATLTGHMQAALTEVEAAEEREARAAADAPTYE